MYAFFLFSIVLGLAPAPTPQQMLERSCTGCHRLDVIRAQHLTRAEWSVELDKMTSMGAKIERRKALLDYLSRNFGN